MNKHVYLESRKCLTRGSFAHNLTDEQLSDADQFRIDQGIVIGQRAHQLYSGGVLVEESSFEKAIQKTRSLMADPNVPAILEATFQNDGYSTKADVLAHVKDGWKLTLRLSSTAQHTQIVTSHL